MELRILRFLPIGPILLFEELTLRQPHRHGDIMEDIIIPQPFHTIAAEGIEEWDGEIGFECKPGVELVQVHLRDAFIDESMLNLGMRKRQRAAIWRGRSGE